MNTNWLNRRRFVAVASTIGLGSVAGCTSSSSEEENKGSTGSLPFTETDDSNFPEFSGEVSISGDEDYWSFKIQKESSFGLRYVVTNMKSETHDFDILVLPREQYNNYIQEIQDTGPIIEDIERFASKEVTSDARKSGELDAGTYFFVADNTDISDAGDFGTEDTREIDIELETYDTEQASLEINIEDNSRTVGIDEEVFHVFYVENTGESPSNQTITTSLNGEQIEEFQIQLKPGESQKYEISISSLSEGENTVIHESQTDTASITYTAEQPDTITHKIGERFIAGDGDMAVEYMVKEATAFEEIGGSALNIQSDGIFLVIEIAITNRGNETFSIDSDLFTVVNQDGAQYEVVSGNSYIAADNSIDGEPILFDEIQPNIETDGAVAFDVPYGASTALVIEPAGFFSTASDHLVNIGTMPTRDET